MMTSRLPKMAAMIINTIMNAEKTVIKTLIHSWSIISSVLVLLKLLIVVLEFETAETISLIVWIFSVVNDEEDDNLGDNVSDDDMFACDVQLLIFCLFPFTHVFSSLLFPLQSNQCEMMKSKLNHNNFLYTFDVRIRRSCCENYVDVVSAEGCWGTLLLFLIELCIEINNVTFTWKEIKSRQNICVRSN